MKEYMKNSQKHIQEEMDGVLEYIKLSKMADESGDHGNAAILRDMAKEEYCHAKMWKEMIHEAKDIPAPANHDEMTKKWEEMESQIHDL